MCRGTTQVEAKRGDWCRSTGEETPGVGHSVEGLPAEGAGEVASRPGPCEFEGANGLGTR